MFDRLGTSPVQWSAAASLLAMLALNVFALSQQLEAASQMTPTAALARAAMA